MNRKEGFALAAKLLQEELAWHEAGMVPLYAKLADGMKELLVAIKEECDAPWAMNSLCCRAEWYYDAYREVACENGESSDEALSSRLLYLSEQYREAARAINGV